MSANRSFDCWSGAGSGYHTARVCGNVLAHWLAMGSRMGVTGCRPVPSL
jgi:hypothetical protein